MDTKELVAVLARKWNMDDDLFAGPECLERMGRYVSEMTEQDMSSDELADLYKKVKKRYQELRAFRM